MSDSQKAYKMFDDKRVLIDPMELNERDVRLYVAMDQYVGESVTYAIIAQDKKTGEVFFLSEQDTP